MEEGQDKKAISASNRLWLVISLVIAVTVVAVLMVPDAREEAEDIPSPAALPEPSPATEAETSPAEAETAVTESGSARDGDAARRYLAEAAVEGLTGDAIFSRAGEFVAQGQLADAWLLYFKASKDGHAGAAMALAEQADPQFFKAGETVLSQPDVVQAHKWYLQAQRSGSELAGQRLQQLLAGLEKSAQAGDEQAAVLLQKWK